MKKLATKTAACLWMSMLTTMGRVILKSYPCQFLVGLNFYVRSYMLQLRRGGGEAGDKDDLLDERQTESRNA
jgi:hypothetical protein